MKLLIITQKVDPHDPLLGFFYRWIEEFAKHVEQVSVICLQSYKSDAEVGSYRLPANVRVYSLGKEGIRGSSRFSYLKRFYSLITIRRNEYDVVFVHMNPIYVVLGGPVWKLLGKKISLWYAHRSVDLKLRIAEKYADVVYTTAPESFRLSSTKVVVTGHGIDVERFARSQRTKEFSVEPIRLVSVGRITPIKNCVTLIEAAHILETIGNKKFEVIFVGSPVTVDDHTYRMRLVSLIAEYGLQDQVSFRGDILPSQMPELYSSCDATVNLTPTGGMDKAVLESMAAGTPVFSSNRAFRDYFVPYDRRLLFRERDAKSLATQISIFFSQTDQKEVGLHLQSVARKKADVVSLIACISESLSQFQNRTKDA